MKLCFLIIRMIRNAVSPPRSNKKSSNAYTSKKDISDSIQAASTIVQGYLKDVSHRALRNTAKRSVTKQATFVAEDPRSPLSRAPRLTCQTHHYAFYSTHCPKKLITFDLKPLHKQKEITDRSFAEMLSLFSFI